MIYFVTTSTDPDEVSILKRLAHEFEEQWSLKPTVLVSSEWQSRSTIQSKRIEQLEERVNLLENDLKLLWKYARTKTPAEVRAEG